MTDAVGPPQRKFSNTGRLVYGGRVEVVCEGAGTAAAAVQVMSRGGDTDKIMCCCETVLRQIPTFCDLNQHLVKNYLRAYNG